MADVKISALTALASVADDDVLPIVDVSAGQTRKVTVSKLRGTPVVSPHQSTHLKDGSDQIDGDAIDIDWVPTYYTREATDESEDLEHLTSHLKGIDNAIGLAAPTLHADSHIKGGSDEIDGDTLDIDWTPTHYTPQTTPQSDSPNHLASHLAGIDAGLVTGDTLDFGTSRGLDSNLSAIGITNVVDIDTNAGGFGGALKLSSDGRFDTADASAMTSMPCMALALAGGHGQNKPVLLLGLIRNDSWSWTPGSLIYVSSVGGLLTQSIPAGAGRIVQVVGIAKTSTILFFNPSYVVVERVS